MRRICGEMAAARIIHAMILSLDIASATSASDSKSISLSSSASSLNGEKLTARLPNPTSVAHCDLIHVLEPRLGARSPAGLFPLPGGLPRRLVVGASTVAVGGISLSSKLNISPSCGSLLIRSYRQSCDSRTHHYALGIHLPPPALPAIL